MWIPRTGLHYYLLESKVNNKNTNDSELHLCRYRVSFLLILLLLLLLL